METRTDEHPGRERASGEHPGRERASGERTDRARASGKHTARARANGEPALDDHANAERDTASATSTHTRALVSACLLGRECRYDGRSNPDGALERELAARGIEPVPFCPEEHGGLPTPRPPAWIEATSSAAVVEGRERVLTDAGADVTAAYLRGAEGALETCRAHGIRLAFLKERSPSCGVCQTHAGGRLVAGPGVTTELLSQNGIEVRGVEGRRP